MTLEDVLGAVGVALVGVGLVFVFWPAALIFLGLVMVTFGVLRARG